VQIPPGSTNPPLLCPAQPDWPYGNDKGTFLRFRKVTWCLGKGENANTEGPGLREPQAFSPFVFVYSAYDPLPPLHPLPGLRGGKQEKTVAGTIETGLFMTPEASQAGRQPGSQRHNYFSGASFACVNLRLIGYKEKRLRFSHLL
jgi:hypothetical protein